MRNMSNRSYIKLCCMRTEADNQEWHQDTDDRSYEESLWSPESQRSERDGAQMDDEQVRARHGSRHGQMQRSRARCKMKGRNKDEHVDLKGGYRMGV
jgi:hypothetical protein